MGGCCCCASRRAESDRVPIYFYCPPELEGNEPLSGSHVTSAAIPVGLLVDTNLDTSSPDTYRAPPAPLPYDVGLACSETESHGNKTNHPESTTDRLPAGEITNPGGFENSVNTCKNLEGECKSKSDTTQDSPKEKDDEISNLKDSSSPAMDEEDEDVCPTCLEEYDKGNPRIITKCEHHFHLSCILEWMERSHTCPICDQIMVIDHACKELVSVFLV